MKNGLQRLLRPHNTEFEKQLNDSGLIRLRQDGQDSGIMEVVSCLGNKGESQHLFLVLSFLH